MKKKVIEVLRTNGLEEIEGYKYKNYGIYYNCCGNWTIVSTFGECKGMAIIDVRTLNKAKIAINALNNIIEYKEITKCNAWELLREFRHNYDCAFI